jgi:hypothetical protein
VEKVLKIHRCSYGWEPVPEPIKDPELFQRVTKLVMDELKNSLDQSF